MPTFFVSYTTTDERWAEWIAGVLRDAGYGVVLQKWHMVPGTHWLAEMDRAMRESSHTIAVVSAAYLRSAYGTAEWQEAYRTDREGRHRRLIPVRIEDCAVDGLLARVTRLDLVDLPPDVAAERLLDGIRAVLTGSAEPTGPITYPGRASSAYVEQVWQIAPPTLDGRDAELAELAAFCTAPDGPSYAWWRASAWTGKTALLSWFVLHPPAKTRVVSFFVTARFAANSDRSAFTEVLLEQLGDVTGQALPSFLPAATREARLLRELGAAAEVSARRGERLVLVVDGLDEDARTDGRSIAALLPVRPPENLRIVVAGRPDPPLPDDVPGGHPLTDAATVVRDLPGSPHAAAAIRPLPASAAVVRDLPGSPHAAVVRADMQRELDRLWNGSTLEQDLLALVVAAGGGLSTADLAALADGDASEYAVERAVGSRTFATRRGHWTGATVHVLGHEELHREAVRRLGPGRLGELRGRLHAWADQYRARGWPPDTPEYLLRGYFRLLQDAGDLPRLVACATDRARHDRMLDVVGGDTAALAEIADAQHAVRGAAVAPGAGVDAVRGAGVDLAVMARLAVHRTRITERNANIPALLPAVWARLGHGTRAEELARALATRPDRRVRALAELAVALSGGSASGSDRSGDGASREGASDAGRAERADELVRLAEQIGRAVITSVADRRHVLRELCRVLLRGGDLTAAERVARGADDPAEVAGALVRLGQDALELRRPDQAEALFRGLDDPVYRLFGLGHLAQHLADAEPGRARALIGEVRKGASRIQDDQDRSRVAGTAAIALARLGALDDASRVAAREIPHQEFQARAWLAVAQHAVRAGETGRALRLVRRVDKRTVYLLLDYLDDLWEPMADILARAGRPDEAARIAERYSDEPTPAAWLSTRVRLGALAARGGDPDRVVAIARQITEPADQDAVRVVLSAALAEAGDLVAAERIAHRVAHPAERGRALLALAAALTSAHNRDAAARPQDAADRDGSERGRAGRDGAGRDGAGRDGAGRDGAGRAAAGGAGLGVPGRDGAARDEPARSRSGRGAAGWGGAGWGGAGREAAGWGGADLGRAERIVRAIPLPDARADGLVALSVAALDAGDHAAAIAWAREAEQVARAAVDQVESDRAHAELSRSAARAGLLDDAERAARRIQDLPARVHALSDVARAAAVAGDDARVRRLATDLRVAAARIEDPDQRLSARIAACLVTARAGDVDGARRVATEIDDRLHGSFRARAALAAELAGAGNVAAALNLARSARFVRDRAKALASVAIALVTTAAPGAGRGASAPATSGAAPGETAAAASGADGCGGGVAGETVAAVLQEAEAALAGHATGAFLSGSDAVAAALLETGDAVGARRVVGDDPPADGSYLSRERVRVLLATTSDLDHAEKVIRAMADPHAGIGGFLQLIRATAETGQYDRARALADELPGRYRTVGLLQLSVTAAGSGAYALADRVAREIDNDDDRGRALASLAEAYHHAGYPDRAVALLAEVMSTGHWAGPALGVLPDVAPAAIATLSTLVCDGPPFAADRRRGVQT
ncbi:toll/interleukin-1 receptor domain-containing protein [Cryptosporangium aurantiacum]|uniref:TIR domain-containing protein n=1 Tax=Cryptosporangium aurantiacum TaxID=134849 RepID=A0A1M7RKJ0_9ACTN|nr:toll/interleukin-1 receptor domain-containing protein [Cryptosporangium aurantiacum]SHN46682.1 TIR domain-containing protein [Cryptosporangium aurantiacum]